jgi:hypothetical protein
MSLDAVLRARVLECLALSPTPLDAAAGVALGPPALAASRWLGAAADVAALARGLVSADGCRATDTVLAGVSSATAAASMALAITLSNAYQV